ncbi:unnamed protein product [Heligmosomoides polygyrus]|uniref:E3 ubiquitin-protein ligase n=1 Tax=Heligmosomoides polygyrus TaxID=6339 RepID=A0A3P8E9J1_HELPZ|nr:unnamed protein product [Heligmosomoides polygyrus]
MVEDGDDEECPVCAQKMILPTAVPSCGHKFCFLCIKGAAFRTASSLCPICRGEVSNSTFRSPIVHNVALDMRDPDSPSISLPSSSSRNLNDTRFRYPDPNNPKSGVRKIAVVRIIQKSGVCKEEETADAAEDGGAPAQSSSDKVRCYWLYKGRRGWWRYDPRAEKDIEAARAMGEKTTELIICGFLYILDFERMVQYRKDVPYRRRSILWVFFT